MRCLTEGHSYLLSAFEAGGPDQLLDFIKKSPVTIGSVEMVTEINGTTNEEVLAVLIDRLNYLNKKFPCRENAIAITHIETALLWLNKRTADRKARGVEGLQKA